MLKASNENKNLKNGVPEGIRTPDTRLRRPLLYPTELLARIHKLHQKHAIAIF